MNSYRPFKVVWNSFPSFIALSVVLEAIVPRVRDPCLLQNQKENRFFGGVVGVDACSVRLCTVVIIETNYSYKELNFDKC